MNYEEITNMALSYSDRTDAELVDKMPLFIKMVEARVNRKVRTMDMTTRAAILTKEEQHYYGLPSLFAGMRDIEIREQDATKGLTGTYLNPEQMNNETLDTSRFYYTIVADQIQIYPTYEDKVLELVYYQRLPTLQSGESNWLSERYPDVYIAGLVVEIESYVKNEQGTNFWNNRFASIIQEMVSEDATDRWSGTPLTVKVG